jgi:hypothetical protein
MSWERCRVEQSERWRRTVVGALGVGEEGEERGRHAAQVVVGGGAGLEERQRGLQVPLPAQQPHHALASRTVALHFSHAPPAPCALFLFFRFFITVAFVIIIAFVVVVVGSGCSAAGCLVGLQRASGQARTHLSPHAGISHEGLQAERHHICTTRPPTRRQHRGRGKGSIHE